MIADMDIWNNTYGKPLMISEYGAESIQGLHYGPSKVFTEDYQSELIMKYTTAYDVLRNDPHPYLIGEQIWNFADFMTMDGNDRKITSLMILFHLMCNYLIGLLDRTPTSARL